MLFFIDMIWTVLYFWYFANWHLFLRYVYICYNWHCWMLSIDIDRYLWIWIINIEWKNTSPILHFLYLFMRQNIDWRKLEDMEQNSVSLEYDYLNIWQIYTLKYIFCTILQMHHFMKFSNIFWTIFGTKITHC